MTIKDYLANPTDYETGVKLYNANTGPGRWERKFAPSTPHRVVHKNLLYELEKIGRKGSGVSINDEIVPKNVTSVPESATIVRKFEKQHHQVETPVEDLPVVYPAGLEGKELEARDLYRAAGRRRDHLFSEDKEVRAAAATFIVTTMKKNRKMWDDINYFREHSIWPADDDARITVSVEDKTLPELYAMAKNLPPWISKEKKKIAVETDPEVKKKRIAQLATQEALLKQVKGKLS
jgi:hypothetical protein